MKDKKTYYALAREGDVAHLYIFGDITSFAWPEYGEVSASNVCTQLKEMEGVSEIRVHISSYGGEVKEGLAIYNMLAAHPARVTTVCESFACSIASVIFMAGEERVMRNASLLMVHNAWARGCGNAEELRKQADDLDVITEASKAAYLSRVSIDADELTALMDAETWIDPQSAVDMGFATAVDGAGADEGPAQCARQALFDLVMASKAAKAAEAEPQAPPAAEPLEAGEAGGQEEPPEPAGDAAPAQAAPENPETDQKKASAGLAFAELILGLGKE